MSKHPIKSWPESVGGAVATIARKLFTSADPEVQNRAVGPSERDIENAKKRASMQNFFAIKSLLTNEEYNALLHANDVSTQAERDAVIAAELRQRGFPVAGETVALPQKPAPAVAPAATQLPLPVMAAPVVASVIVDSVPLVTAIQYQRMTPAARADFAASGGEMSPDEFHKLDPKARMAFMLAGGKMTAEPAKPTPKPPLEPQAEAQARNDAADRARRDSFRGNGSTKTRAELDAMKPDERMRFFRDGGKLSD